jgi:hypothetical protein
MGRLGKKKLTGGARQSVRERGNGVDWAGAGLADPGSAQCCLFSFFFVLKLFHFFCFKFFVLFEIAKLF